MSGDVQPRKRKDKRRKKADGEYTIQRIRGASCDEDEAGTPPPTLVSPTENVESVAIHIDKESSTGGHWCARIIFFTLSAILIGLIGIIIFEYRGATDVDTPIASSQWAMIFDGWVDDVPFLHNEEHTGQEVQSGEHEEDGDEKSEEDEDHDEGLGDEEDSHEDEDGDEGEEDEHEETDKDAGESVEEDEVDYEDGREKETFNSPEEGEMLDDSEENQKLDNDEGYEDNFEETDELGVLEEVDDNSGEESSNANEEILNEPETDLDDSLEGVKASEEKFDDEALDEFMAIPGVPEIDNSAEPLEEVDEEEPEEVLNDVEETEEKEEEEEEEASSVAVKFGVGVALVVAAHFVLVRRWNNGDADIPENLIGIEELPDLTRRNTIVPPPHIKQISTKQSTQEFPSRKQTQNYEDLRAKYKTLGSDEALDQIAVKKVADLQAEKLIKPKEESDIQTEAKTASEEEDYTETSDGEQITDSEELEGEEEEEEDDDEEIEEIDDSELVAKLEAKYGKLPTPTESEGDDEEEEDEEDEEEDEEDEEEEEEEDMKGWKHVKAPKEAEAGTTQKTQMGLNTKLSSSAAVPETSNIANLSTSPDLTTSEELRNPHLQGPDN